ncbi:bifunctional diaminohydroxyphosphoribosylaminopyrimidine deaminase/5-amino-6-(5-phosphoribosylamino)uracil reductase RibD [Robiginitalea sp. SC105]|nr:bifunctional diaminohydroxyphosphoribosylaminopyrimidine deaminase/5-amino-6-(5-phosphoribosylamino)uracil reductase RibD [Robiginitalea sp. SC105]
MKIQEKYILRCIQIAKNALGRAAPNPMVGALIVYHGRVIGAGYTSPFGGPHAEVNAIRSVRDPGQLRDSTLYVTLEPCCHHGKTPPCTDLILESGIPRVVVGIPDPHDKVGGKGIARLREAGCEVILGPGEAACREHHRRFLTFHEKKRPYLILKWAQSPDGFLAPVPAVRAASPSPHWITGRESRQLVHKWRTQEAAILVGWRTAAADNPRLTSRSWAGQNPLRILLDPGKKTPPASHLLDGKVPTLRVVNEAPSADPVPAVEYLVIAPGDRFLGRLSKELFNRGVLSLIVEGGAHTLNSFLDEGLWDEARVFTGPAPLGDGLRAPQITGRLMESTKSGGDRLDIWRNG